MILYKYLPPEGGKDIIEHLRIKVSNVKDFNDPFDSKISISESLPEEIKKSVLNNEDYLRHLHVSEGIKIEKSYELFKRKMQDSLTNQEVTKKIAKTLTEKLRAKHKEFLENQQLALMSCFCGEPIKSDDEILMWAHYTLNHTGMRITFDSECFKGNGISMIKINYKTERVLWKPTDFPQKGYEPMIEVVRKALEEKSCVWSYENEYRLLVLSELCKKEKDKMFFPIKPNAILGVDLGLRYKIEDFAIRDLIRNNLGENVWIRKAQPDNHEFKMQYIELKDS